MAAEKIPPITNKTQLFINWILITLRESAWAPLIVSIYYWFVTEIGLIRKFSHLDNINHVLAGIAITYTLRSAIENSQEPIGKIPKPVQILLAFTTAGTLMIFWEFFQNIVDLVFNATQARRLRDTLGDLFYGLLGAFLFSLFFRVRSTNKN